ncbi:hypothetical protein KHA80_07995 [Anaerobacillus sp. HL2]|nr:hypothetical protein KHA80_07995 [Anaerobacillus sp. HL2]
MDEATKLLDERLNSRVDHLLFVRNSAIFLTMVGGFYQFIFILLLCWGSKIF